MRVAIVDDEELARRRIRELLEDESEFDVVAEFGDPVEAAERLGRLDLDLVFVDVQMPELDGFAVIEQVGVDRIPAVVFITAHDQFALQAFDVHALDYLVKPFTGARFDEVLERARRRCEHPRADGDLTRRLRDLLRSVDRVGTGRIPVPKDGRVQFVRHEDIDWIEASRNRVILHVGSEAHPIRATMTGVLERLPRGKFLRIHRSSIVNVDRIRELQPWSHGDTLVVLADGRHLIATRTYAEALRTELGL